MKYGVLSYRVKYGQNTEQVCTRNTGKSCKICFKYGGEAESYLSLGLNEMLKYKMFSKVNYLAKIRNYLAKIVKNTGRRRFIGSYLPFSAAVWVNINKFGSLKVPCIMGSIRSIFSKPLYYGGNPVIRRRWKVWDPPI